MSQHKASYQLVAIDPTIADRYRADPTATAVVADAPTGYPCRQCLEDAAVGDELILVAHDPFEGSSPYTGTTAIFLHKSPCTPFGRRVAAPEMLVRRRLSLRGYGSDHMMKAAAVVDGTELDAAITGMFDDERVAYLHVHNAAPGCWNCRVVRRD